MAGGALGVGTYPGYTDDARWPQTGKTHTTVAYALILSRITGTYALPAWGGFLSVALIDKINAFFKRLKRFGYTSTCYTVSELIVSCDHDLFIKATRYGHCLGHNSYSPC